MKSDTPRTILLVEDEVLIGKATARQLEHHGYHVALASHGQAALARIAEAPPIELVLMDIQLGKGMSGIETAREILRQRDMPIIFLTAHTDQETVKQVRDITRYGYVSKNSGAFVLLSSIDMAFQLFEAHQQALEDAWRIRKLNRVYRMLSRVNHTIVRIRESTPMLQDACRIAVEDGGFGMAWIGRYDREAGTLTTAARTGPACDALSERHAPTMRAVQTGQYVICNDVAADPEAAAWRDAALSRGYRASAAFPLTPFEQVWGAYTIYAAEAHFFDHAEIELFEKLADDVSFALEAIEHAERRQQAEIARYESEARFRQIYHHMRIGVAQVGLDFRIQHANQAYCQMLGYAETELIGMHLRDITHPEAVAENLRKQRLLAEGALDHYQMEKAFRHKDGHTVHGVLDANLIRDAAGQPVYFLGSVLDITRRKHMEEALRQSEHRLRSYIEHAPFGVFIADEEGRYLDVNPAACRITGYSAKELLRMGIPDLLPPQSHAAGAEHFRHTVDTGEASGELVFRHKSGELRYWAVNAVRLTATRFLGFVEDITARKTSEQEIRRLNADLEDRVQQRTAELERANKELQSFAYIVSHDLKAPLRGIGHLANWLVQDYGDQFDDDGRTMVDLLVGRVKRLDNLIDGILRYSRVGRIVGPQQQIDVNDLLAEVIDTLAPPPAVQIVIPRPLPDIVGDATCLFQVFQNLIGNAVKFLDKPAGRILVEWDDDDDHWRFRVSDNGPGIDPRYHERIFRIFQTLTARDVQENSGIGLAIVKKIVEFSGGAIRLESEDGRGSTFEFTIPKNAPRPHGGC